MAKLRRGDSNQGHEQTSIVPPIKPLRIIASGTLFVTHTLTVPGHPPAGGVVRAQSVRKERGGSANMILSMLAQFPVVESVLVAPLGDNDDGKMIIRELESEGVSTHFCKIWKDVGVPSAWVLHANDPNIKTVINHNPLPDITHEEFVSLLGPLLAPENYLPMSPPSSNLHQQFHDRYLNYSPSSTPRSGPSPSGIRSQLTLLNPNSPAPFDWLHFEGRSVKTTLSNITGLDGLARERKWRSYCVFSVDVGRKGRQGVEALIPHADVLFVNKTYAQANSPSYASSPRAFLLSLTSIAPRHALLIAYWGSEGSAVLSIPTKEYFQSSGWVEERPINMKLGSRDNTGASAANVSGASGTDSRAGQHRPQNSSTSTGLTVEEIFSVRSGSEFWADGRSGTPSSASAFTSRHYSSDSIDESVSTEPEARSDGRGRNGGPEQQDGYGYGSGFSTSGISSLDRGASSTGLLGVGLGHPSNGKSRSRSRSKSRSRARTGAHDDDDNDSQATERGENELPSPSQQQHQQRLPSHSQPPRRRPEIDIQDTLPPKDVIVDEGGAQDAFVAGMIYALSRRLLPGNPYTPLWNGEEGADVADAERGRWRLDECLRFATELSGRKARRRGWEGLSEEMTVAGWFDGL